MPPLRIFRLVRDTDASGVSGTGEVADGVAYDDGLCVLRWRGAVRALAVYPSLADLLAVHGHGGATRAVFIADCSQPAPGGAIGERMGCSLLHQGAVKPSEPAPD